jgi:YggT family protein
MSGIAPQNQRMGGFRVIVLHFIFLIYLIIVLVRVLSSYFPQPRSPVAVRAERVVYNATEPVLRPLRRIVPPLRVGGMMLDLSPAIAVVILGILADRL